MWIDKWVVDGIIARLSAAAVAVTGTLLRYAQTGRVHAYAAVMVAGVLALGWFVSMPHADAKAISDHSSGEYQVQAAPGLGYGYRWDQDGDGEWDTRTYSATRNIKFNLERSSQRTIKLEVKNAFGRTAVEKFQFSRPKPPATKGAPTVIQIGPDGKAILPPGTGGSARPSRGRPGTRPSPGRRAARDARKAVQP